MDNLDNIRTMNDLRPAGYWRERIREPCDRVEELERAASEKAQQGPQETPGAAIAPTSALSLVAVDLSLIRTAAQEGLPVMPGQTLALCARLEALEEAARPLAEYAAAHYRQAAIANEVGYHLFTDDDYPIEVPLGLLVLLRRILLS